MSKKVDPKKNAATARKILKLTKEWAETLDAFRNNRNWEQENFVTALTPLLEGTNLVLTELDKLVELKFYGLPEGVNFNIFIFDAETHNLLVKLEKLQEDLSSVVGAKKLAPRDRSGWGRNLSGRGHALLYDIERLMYMLSYIK